MVAVAAVASAEEQIGARLSYGISGDFNLTNGGSTHLSGPELALQFPLLSQGGTSVWLEPSYFSGGTLGTGSNTKGDVFRFLVTAQQSIPKSGFYLKAGVGFANVAGTSKHPFDSARGTVALFGVGLPLTGTLKSTKSAVEFDFIAADKGQLRGASIGITGYF